MTCSEFLDALRVMRDRCSFVWYEDEMGMLRVWLPPPVATEHSPMTALAYIKSEQLWNYHYDWENASHVLGIAFEDATAIVAAEDQSTGHDQDLAQALRKAVGL